MNLNLATKFIGENQDEVLELFLTYQMIEIMLFIKLNFPKISLAESRDEAIEEINKKINSKTLGKMKREYLSSFPEDGQGLSSLIESVATQRNTFMHSFGMIIASAKNKRDASKIGKIMLVDFQKSADFLLEKLYALKV